VPALPSEGTIASYLGGALTIPPGATRAFDFAAPFGRLLAAPAPLPEQDMLTRAFSVPVECFQAVVDLDSGAPSAAAFMADAELLRDLLRARTERGRERPAAAPFALCVCAQEAMLGFSGQDAYGLTASLCVGVAEQVLAQRPSGVLAASALGDPQALLARLAAAGVRWQRNR
jgi:hypothetical protein